MTETHAAVAQELPRFSAARMEEVCQGLGSKSLGNSKQPLGSVVRRIAGRYLSYTMEKLANDELRRKELAELRQRAKQMENELNAMTKRVERLQQAVEEVIKRPREQQSRARPTKQP